MKRCIDQGWKHGRKDKIDLSEDKKRHAADHKGSRKRGHLTETLIEEFLGHAFAMPVLWDCRSWFYKLDSQTIEAHPMLVCHLALLSALAGRLDEAKAYVDILGETPIHFKAENLGDRDFYRMTTELVMPYVDDTMFLRIVYSLVKVGAVPVRSLVLSACRPSLLNGFRDFTRFGHIFPDTRTRFPKPFISCMEAVEMVYMRLPLPSGSTRITNVFRH